MGRAGAEGAPPGLDLYDPKATTGAVLLQMRADKQLQPVACASRGLANTEGRYAQIEKEAVAVVWARECFSDFLVGLSFPQTLGTSPEFQKPKKFNRLKLTCY